MRCPFCHKSFTLQGPYCPHCGRRILGREPDAQPQPPTAQTPPSQPPSGQPPAGDDDILVVELEPEPTPPAPPIFTPRPPGPPGPPPVAQLPQVQEQPVSDEYVGRICPYCRFPLKRRERMIVCPACKVGHHADCWRENGGCTTYGCRYSPQAHPVTQPPPAAGPLSPGTPTTAQPPTFPLPSPAAVAAAARLEADATSALLISVLGLFCCGVLSLIGIIMGGGVLARMKALGMNLPGARRKAIAAIVVGILFIGLWIALVLISQAAGADWRL